MKRKGLGGGLWKSCILHYLIDNCKITVIMNFTIL